MRDSFGTRLRQKREEQHIPLATIAADTKIKLSLLEALERDDVSGWPSGIFRRGYVRAYARAIGLEPDAVVNEFVALYPEPDDSETPLSAAFPKSAEPDSWRERIWQFGRRASQPETIVTNARPPAAAKVPDAPAADQSAPAGDQSAPAADQSAPAADHTAPAAAQSAPAPDDVPAAPRVDPQEPSAFVPDLAAAAALCTELGQVADTDHLTRALDEIARLVNASGLIIWIWDGPANALVPAFAHGYSPRVLAHLQAIARDSDNPTAAAFRSAQMTTVKRTDRQNGAVVAPLMRAGGCIGVLAIEVAGGIEQIRSACDLVRIIAAQLATLFDVAADADLAAPKPADDQRAAGSG